MHLLHVRNLTCATSYGQVRLCTIHLDVRTLDNAGLQVFSGIYFLFLVGFFFWGGESSDSVALDSFSLGLLGFYVLYYWVFELSDPSTCWWPIASTFVGLPRFIAGLKSTVRGRPRVRSERFASMCSKAFEVQFLYLSYSTST